MVGKAGGRQSQAPINWPSSQRSPEMKGCVHRLEAQAALGKIWNMRPRAQKHYPQGDGSWWGSGVVWPVTPSVMCRVEKQWSHACYRRLAGLHMILGVSFQARCPPYTSSWGPYLDLEMGVPLMLEVRSVMSSQDLEVSVRYPP